MSRRGGGGGYDDDDYYDEKGGDHTEYTEEEMIEYYLPTLKDQLKAKSVTKSQPEMVAALKAAAFDVAAAFKALQSPPKPKTEAKPKAKPKPDAAPKSEAKPQAEAAPKPKAEAKPKPLATTESATKPPAGASAAAAGRASPIPTPASPIVSVPHSGREHSKSPKVVRPEYAPLPAPEYRVLADGDGKHRLSIVVVGHVDAGKSTIMGHLLYTLGLVSKKTMHKYEKEARESGKSTFHFAWVLDEQEEERARGVTIDVGVTYFETPHRRITLLDAPGHKDFVSNMITGAAQADAAVLVVNSVKGEFESGFDSGGQTKEHALLLKSLGVKEVVVAVNKMDSNDFSQERYNQIVEALKPFLHNVGFSDGDLRWCPVAGLTGENLAKRESPLLKAWYDGPTLLDLIDGFKPAERLTNFPLRLCVSDVFKTASLGTTVAGKIEAGRVADKDKVMVMPSGDVFLVKGMERQNESVKEAFAGDNVEIGLLGVTEMNILAVGQVLCSVNAVPVKTTLRFVAQLMTFKSARPITMGYNAVLHIHVLTVPCVISKLIATLTNTLEVDKKRPKCLPKDQSVNCLVEISVQRLICLELFSEFRSLGRFMLREEGETIAAGIVTEIL